MLTTQHIEEGLSRAYVSAVAFRAGVNVAINADNFDYGIDGTFKGINFIGTARKPSGNNLDFQMKASIDWTIDSTHVTYDLEADTYNHLADVMNHFRYGRATPAMLILLCLPKDQTKWLEVDEDQILLRKCCYFHFIEGEPTPNKSTTRIKIDRANKLTPGSVQALLQKIRAGKL